MLSTTDFFLFVGFSTSPTWILIFMALLILPPFTVIKVAIVCAARIGKSFGLAQTCSIIRFLWLKSQLTLCTLTHVLTLRSTTHHYRSTSLHTLTQNQSRVLAVSLTKGLGYFHRPPSFLFLFVNPLRLTVSF